MNQESSSIQINQNLIDKGKWLLNNARAFDSASVIKTIQEQELQRLKDENRNWKMAGAAVGLMLLRQCQVKSVIARYWLFRRLFPSPPWTSRNWNWT